MGRKNLNCMSPENSLADSFTEKHFLTFYLNRAQNIEFVSMITFDASSFILEG